MLTKFYKTKYSQYQSIARNLNETLNLLQKERDSELASMFYDDLILLFGDREVFLQQLHVDFLPEDAVYLEHKIALKELLGIDVDELLMQADPLE